MIEIDNLSCHFENQTVLKDISINIDSHLSILGANGSGKSTLARSLCNLVEFEGTITFDSVNIKELSLKQRARYISYIPAKLEVYDPYIKLFEFVLLGRFAYKKSFFEYTQKDKKIALKYLKLLNIEHLKEHSIHSLSSGEQQLALIASALAQESNIIIFDEPTANLDPYNSKVIAQHIKALKHSHQVILITHDLHLAAFVNSPVVFLKKAKATFYEKDFFNNDTLEKLYKVPFNALAVQYD